MMNFGEALKLLAVGLRIRNPNWKENEFISLSGNYIVDEKGNIFDFDRANYRSDWEEWKFIDHKCEKGDFMCRRSPSGHLFLHAKTKVVMPGYGFSHIMSLSPETTEVHCDSVMVDICPFCGKN